MKAKIYTFLIIKQLRFGTLIKNCTRHTNLSLQINSSYVVVIARFIFYHAADAMNMCWLYMSLAIIFRFILLCF